MKSKLVILLLLLSSFCLATELPLYAKWQSLNSMYYDTLQSGKELSWDEAYRAEFGISRMAFRNMDFALAVETEQFFDEARLRLKSFRIGYQTDELYLQAGSTEHGYGFGYAMDQYPDLESGFAAYSYQPMRLNSLGIGHNFTPNLMLRLDLGGNKHNQASGLVTLAWSEENDFLIFSQDFRVMDNHWRTPVSISAIELSQSWPKIALDGTFALSLLPEWEATEAHFDIYSQAELQVSPVQSSRVALGAVYKKQNYAARETQQVHLRFVQDFGRFSLIPLSNLHIIDSEKLWQHRLMAKYYFAENPSNIGVYYDYSYFAAHQPRHTFGLALDFEFDARDFNAGL